MKFSEPIEKLSPNMIWKPLGPIVMSAKPLAWANPRKSTVPVMSSAKPGATMLPLNWTDCPVVLIASMAEPPKLSPTPWPNVLSKLMLA